MLTVGVDAAVVESDLRGGVLVCPVSGCGGRLAPWGWARSRVIRGVGGVGLGLRPRRSICRVCAVTNVLLPANVLLRRADDVGVVGAGLLAAAGGLGHRRVAAVVGRPASTVRDWLRRAVRVAGRVLAVLGAAAAGFGTEFVAPAATAGGLAEVVEVVGALARAAGRRLGGSRSPWRLASVVTGGRLLAPGGPDLVVAAAGSINTSSLLAGVW
jgi:hypothetical protein